MQVQFIEIYSDIGAGKHGTTHGVAMLSAHCEKYSPNAPVQRVYANHQTHQPKHPKAKYIESLLPFFEHKLVPTVQDCLAQAQQTSHFPVVISGDHSNAIGNLAAFANFYTTAKIGVVWIDAHADLHSVFTTPSGNIHGMPLAVALRLDNLDCQINELSDEVLAQWQAFKGLSKHKLGIASSDVFFLGLRSFEPPEAYLIKEQKMFAYSAQGEHIPANDTPKQDLSVILDTLVTRLAQLDAVYVSFDVDALDDSLIPATGTPEPKGYREDEVRQIFECLLALPNVKLFEITEFNPTLDDDQDKHQTIFALLDYAIEQIYQR